MSPARGRQSLAQILAESSAAPEDNATAPDGAPEAAPVTSTEDSATRPAGAAEPQPPAPEAAPTPARSPAVWTGYDRKEARLRPDQAEQLTHLARALQRARPKMPGERITDNTLIRVAVDLLLQRQDRLVGHTEDELRASVADPDTNP